MTRMNTLILAAGLILAAFLNGGVYQIVGGAYRLNRFTGEVMVISGNRMVKVEPPYRTPWFRKEEPAPLPPPPVVPR
jgi:hypothetical protein